MSPEILVVIGIVLGIPVLIGLFKKSSGGADEEQTFLAWKAVAREFGLSLDESTLEVKDEYRGYQVLALLPKKEGGAKKNRAMIDMEAPVEIRVAVKGIWKWGLEVEAVDFESALDHLDAAQSDIGVYELADGFRFACPPLAEPKVFTLSFGAHAHVREVLGEGTKFEVIDGELGCAFSLKKNPRDVIHQLNMAVETARQLDETGLMATSTSSGEDSAPMALQFVRPVVEKSEEEGGGITLLPLNRMELLVFFGDEMPEKLKPLTVLEEGTVSEVISAEGLGEEAEEIVAKLLEKYGDLSISAQAIRLGREIDPGGAAPTDWVVDALEMIEELRALLG